MVLEWVTAVGAGRALSCNCNSTGGPLSFWVLHSQCWWMLEVHFKSCYVVIQLMEFSMSRLSHLLQIRSVLVPAALKSCAWKQTSSFSQTKACACSIVWSLQIKNDMLTPWCMSHSSASAASETSLLWEPFLSSLFTCSRLKGLMCLALSRAQGHRSLLCETGCAKRLSGLSSTRAYQGVYGDWHGQDEVEQIC